MNLKDQPRKPEKCGSGVKEDNYVFLSDNIHTGFSPQLVPFWFQLSQKKLSRKQIYQF